MKLKHLSKRTCIGCRKIGNKKELVRVVLKNKQIILDKNYQYIGRGAYLCKIKNLKLPARIATQNVAGGKIKNNSQDKTSNRELMKSINTDCLKLAIKRKAFNYAFKTKTQIKQTDFPPSDRFHLGPC